MPEFTSYSQNMVSASVFRNLGGYSFGEQYWDKLSSYHKEMLKKSDILYKIRRGKQDYIVLSHLEIRVIYALSAWLSNFNNDLKFKECVNSLLKDPLNSKSFSCSVDLKWIAQKVFRKSKKQQIDKIKFCLDALASKRQVYILISKNNKSRFKDTIVKESPLIIFGDSTEIYNKEKGTVSKYYANITFGKFFLWDYFDKYSRIVDELYEIMGTKKSHTDTTIFYVLLNTLLYNWWHVISAYKSIPQQLTKEYKENGLKHDKEYDEELKRRRSLSLIYSENLKTVLERCGSQWYSNTRQYKRLEKDIEYAAKTFKKINLITNYSLKEINGERKLFFVYNTNYGKETHASQKR